MTQDYLQVITYYLYSGQTYIMAKINKKHKSILRDIRSQSNSKETLYLREKRYGHNCSTAVYFKEGLEVAKVFRTDGEIGHISYSN